MHVIGLSGPKGSGKDTVGEIIKSLVPMSRTIAYADPIKAVIQSLFDLDPSSNEQYDLFKRTAVEYSLTGYLRNSVEGRHLVREIGMLMRSYNENQFTSYVEDQIKHNPSKLWVVTDMRFENELRSLKHLDAVLINVVRPGFEYDGHVTESGFPEGTFHYTIVNQGDRSDLVMQVECLLDNIFSTWSCDETHSWA